MAVLSGTACTEDNTCQWFKAERAGVQGAGKGAAWTRGEHHLFWWSVFAILNVLFLPTDDGAQLSTGSMILIHGK